MHICDEMGQCCPRQVTTANGMQPIPRKDITIGIPKENGRISSRPQSTSTSNKPSLQTSIENSSSISSHLRQPRNSSRSKILYPKPRLPESSSSSFLNNESRSECELLKSSTRKSFGYTRSFSSKYKLGPEVGCGRFGYTLYASTRSSKSQTPTVAVKIIRKAKMKTLSDVQDVEREVKILKSLSGHTNMVQFYEVYEDHDKVYIVMELCTGGELLNQILQRGGPFTEEDAKAISWQMLSAVAFIHLQGVVHRDLKPENFLFKSKDEGFRLKLIDFGLSDFVQPDGKLTDIVGSAYYVAPEVLDQSYNTEADLWSIGVIVYILLSANRPFWAPTESGIFDAVKQVEPDFEEAPWPSISAEAKDFVQRLLQKNPRKRLTAAQSLAHPWLRGGGKVPLDMQVLMLIKSYLKSSTLRRSALKALAKTFTDDDFHYLGSQYMLLKPEKDGSITLENFKMALLKSATQAMKESHAWKILNSMNALAAQKMYFPEFCAAAVNVHQLELKKNWEENVRKAYEHFNKKGNRLVSVQELAEEMRIPETVPVSTFLHEWVRLQDGKLSYKGFTELLLA